MILSLAGATRSIIFVATKLSSWQNMSFVRTKVCLPGQNYIFVAHSCRDQKMHFVATNTCLSQQNFRRDKTGLLFWQKYACRDKTTFLSHTLVATKDAFCRDKHMFVTTKLLSRQKWYLWQLPPMTDMMQQTGSSRVYSAALLQGQPKQPAKVVVEKGLWPLVMESHAWKYQGDAV